MVFKSDREYDARCKQKMYLIDPHTVPQPGTELKCVVCVTPVVVVGTGMYL